MADGEAHLAKRAAKGDRVALEVLYRRYVDRVWRYAWLRTHSREEAAEIVQDVFLRVMRSIRGFQGRSSLSTWLFAVTRSVAIERARRAVRDRARGDEPGVIRIVAAAEDESGSVEGGEVREAVRTAVADLPGSQRDAIVLCELSGFSIREAGEVLGWGESRVKVTLFRARRGLRDRLGAYVGEGDRCREVEPS